jgi:hypothetical protein
MAATSRSKGAHLGVSGVTHGIFGILGSFGWVCYLGEMVTIFCLLFIGVFTLGISTLPPGARFSKQYTELPGREGRTRNCGKHALSCDESAHYSGLDSDARATALPTSTQLFRRSFAEEVKRVGSVFIYESAFLFTLFLQVCLPRDVLLRLMSTLLLPLARPVGQGNGKSGLALHVRCQLCLNVNVP